MVKPWFSHGQRCISLDFNHGYPWQTMENYHGSHTTMVNHKVSMVDHGHASNFHG